MGTRARDSGKLPGLEGAKAEGLLHGFWEGVEAF